jgi:hypothetical protein
MKLSSRVHFLIHFESLPYNGYKNSIFNILKLRSICTIGSISLFPIERRARWHKKRYNILSWTHRSTNGSVGDLNVTIQSIRTPTVKCVRCKTYDHRLCNVWCTSCAWNRQHGYIYFGKQLLDLTSIVALRYYTATLRRDLHLNSFLNVTGWPWSRFAI